MRAIYIIVLIISTTILNSYSQNTVCCYDSASEKIYEQKIVAKLFANPLVNNNNQYYNNWVKGKVYLENREVVSNELLRLNRYVNELLWLRKSDYKTGVVEKSLVDGFTLDNDDKKEVKKFRKLKIKNWYSSDSVDVFIEMLVEGDITLGIFRTSRLNKNTNELTLKNIPYVIKDGKGYSIKAGRGGLYSLHFVDKNLMKSVIKSNHLKVRKEEGLKKAIELYNNQKTSANRIAGSTN